MKPLQHAKATEKRHGGTWSDYIEIHNLIDSSKLTLATTHHRALLHNELGVAIAIRVFGTHLKNADGENVPVVDIVSDHLIEDIGHVPAIDEWLSAMPQNNPIKCHRRLSSRLSGFKEDPCLAAASHFGGDPSSYARIVDFFDICSDFSKDPRSQAFLHNTFGIWLAERALGVAVAIEIIPGQQKLIAVREVSELLVQARMNGFIPTPQILFEGITISPWMRGEDTGDAFKRKRVKHSPC